MVMVVIMVVIMVMRILIDEVDKLWKNHNLDLVATHSPFDSWSEIFSLFVLAATDKIQLFHIFII